MNTIQMLEEEVNGFLATAHTADEINELRHQLGDMQERLLLLKRAVAAAYNTQALIEKRAEDLREKSDEELQAELERRKLRITATTEAPPTFNFKGYEVGE